MNYWSFGIALFGEECRYKLFSSWPKMTFVSLNVPKKLVSVDIHL